MKPISFSCAGCGTRLAATRPDILGKKICCPRCEKICRVPAGPPKALALAARKGPAWPGPRGVSKVGARASKRALTVPGILATLLLFAYPWLVAAMYYDLLLDPSAYRLRTDPAPAAAPERPAGLDAAAAGGPAEEVVLSRP
jgi:hypothetical protein